jgi:hypothetical protein
MQAQIVAKPEYSGLGLFNRVNVVVQFWLPEDCYRSCKPVANEGLERLHAACVIIALLQIVEHLGSIEYRTR